MNGAWLGEMMDPVLRCLLASLRRRSADMARACADDLAVALRSARLAGDQVPVHTRKRKASVPMHGDAEAQPTQVRVQLLEGAPAWSAVEIVPTGSTWVCRSAARNRPKCGPPLWPSGGCGQTSCRASRCRRSRRRCLQTASAPSAAVHGGDAQSAARSREARPRLVVPDVAPPTQRDAHPRSVRLAAWGFAEFPDAEGSCAA